MNNAETVRIHLPKVSEKDNRAQITMPYFQYTRGWLHAVCGVRADIRWDKRAKQWTVSRGQFQTVVQALADRFGSVTVTQDFTKTQYCTAQCQGARSTADQCECSCAGRGHGGGFPASWTDGQLYVSHELQTTKHTVYASNVAQLVSA